MLSWKCDGARRGDRDLSKCLADTCGTKLSGNRVNESWRASEAAGWFVLQYYPSLSVEASVVWPRSRWRGQRVASLKQWKGSWRQITCCWTVEAGLWWQIGDIRVTRSVLNLSVCSFPHGPVTERLPWCISAPWHFRPVWRTLTFLWWIAVSASICRCADVNASQLSECQRVNIPWAWIFYQLLKQHPLFCPKCNCTWEVTFWNTRLR